MWMCEHYKLCGVVVGQQNQTKQSHADAGLVQSKWERKCTEQSWAFVMLESLAQELLPQATSERDITTQ